ncbi:MULTISPECIES: hypothetical protein [Streptomyces]|uniref:hypothetical protein n=1 Tax=Streptomyces TaxID=1883 RepID=UPI0022AEC5BD|nr:hypothetical protein [Streptomyces sp. H39-C1]MCZ4102213.1 hypothetical protein [Streptomyces sp. H39-C1]
MQLRRSGNRIGGGPLQHPGGSPTVLESTHGCLLAALRRRAPMMSRTPGAASTPPVLVEALLLRYDAVTGFAYRRLLTALGRSSAPDRAARRLAGLPDDGDHHLVHSTSWRADDEGAIVLTYVVHPDPDPDRPARPLADPHTIARSNRTGHPAPPDLTVDHVASHAVRHLALLESTDPVVAAFLAARPQAQDALSRVSALLAGQLRSAPTCSNPR